MRSGVEDRRLRVVEQHRDRGESEGERRDDQEIEDDELHLRRLDLLAEVLGSPPDHEPGDEDREQGEDEHPVEAGADASRRDLAEHHVRERHGAAERREAVVRRVDRTGRRARRRGGEERRTRPGRSAPPSPRSCRHRVVPERLHLRVAVDLESGGDADGRDPEDEHRREDRPALTLVADEPSEGVRERERDRKERDDLEEVGEAGRVLERVRRVRVRDPAAVRPELLDRLLACDGRPIDRLRRSLDGRRVGGAGQRLDDALAHEHERDDAREREEDAHGRPREVDPEVADRLRAAANEAANQGHGDGDPDGCRDEVLHRQAGHLGQMAHRRLAAVVLPVRVRRRSWPPC